MKVAFQQGKHKPLKLPRHKWQAFHGRTGEPKPRCIRCKGTTKVKCLVREPDAATYSTTELQAHGCGETRVLASCMDVDTSERRRILARGNLEESVKDSEDGSAQ